MKTEKLERYREERKRYLAKLDSIQAHVKELDRKITECENLEIRALMQTENMTLADLMAMVREMQELRRAPYLPAMDSGDNAYFNDTNDEEETESNEEI